ncbi:heme exporter protein CcmD [Erwinia sp. CPCC 100877]|nr:heme exporter protein CcmD [Erwinia sp. CPCC 100877]
MQLAFDSWQDFWAMGGYAFYVWLAVTVTAIALFGLVGHTLWQRRVLLEEVRRQHSRERRIRAAQQNIIRSEEG